MKLINKYQNGGKKVHIIGIGSDADSKSLELLNKVDTDKFFGVEVKKFNNKSELQPHEAGAVLDYMFNKYDIKNKYKKAFPNLSGQVDKKFNHYNDWRVYSDSIASNNPSNFLKSESVISDPQDLALYNRALKERQRWLGLNTVIEDVKGSGPKSYEIGFRTVTMPWTNDSFYQHVSWEGKSTELRKKWIFDGKQFKAIPLSK